MSHDPGTSESCRWARPLLAPAVWLSLAAGCAGSPQSSSGPGDSAPPGREDGAATQPSALPLEDAAKLPASDRTQILVLATPHLLELECLTSDMVGPLIDKLLRWQPDVIAVEALPGDTIAALKTRSDDFAELMQPFTKSTVEAGELAATALKLDASASRHELRQTVTAGTTGSTDRVRLALLFAAAYDYPSAVLQWSYLSPPERARAKLPDPLRTRLDQSLSGNNEIYAIAVPLARRLGLDRLALVDDFFGEEAYATRVDAFVEEVERSPQVKELSSAPFYVESTERLQATCGAPEKLSAHYEWMNSLQYGKQDAALQWGVWFRTRFESGLDRARYAGWEARNLGIAAHVRKETSLHPGKRVLVIYGAAHKPFLDLYLSQLGDVDVVQLGDLDPKGRTITQ